MIVHASIKGVAITKQLGGLLSCINWC